MTKYYLVIIKDDSQTVYAYDDIVDATGAFHSEMAYACAQKINTTCILTETYGSQIKFERYENK